MRNFVARDTTRGLVTTQCDSQIVVPPFKLAERPVTAPAR